MNKPTPIVFVSGSVYRAKQPRVGSNGFVNDRVILAIDGAKRIIHYGSPSIPMSRKRMGKCPVSTFEAWAGEDVTDLLKGQWQRGLDATPEA